jgi:hypothetical protein
MKTFFNLLSVSILLYVVFWFLKFQLNPYEFCIDHPKKELNDHYYLCEPFDFELKKGIIENKSNFIPKTYGKQNDKKKGGNKSK